MYFDDIRLVGPQKTVVLGDFEQGVGQWAGLEVSDEQAHGGRRSGKWHNLPLHTSARLSEIPTDWSEFDSLEFWCYAPQATGATAQLILDSDQPQELAADQICRHIMQGHDFGPDIDWSADPNNYREWTYAINRFFHWRTLAEAYWNTGDERYAKEFCDQLRDWVRKNPVPLMSSGNGAYTWRTIECGIRQSTTWPDSLYRVLGSPSFTPEVAAVMTRSMVEHARHLPHHAQHGDGHRHGDDRLAEGRHRAALAAYAAREGLAEHVELDVSAGEIDLRLIGVLHAELHQHADLHALPRQRLHAGHGDLERILVRHARATAEGEQRGDQQE